MIRVQRRKQKLNVRTAIKFLVEDGRFDYIESGSLLGVRYKEVRSYPVGFEEIYRMYPMDFEEYLYLPWYMVMFLKQGRLQEGMKFEVDLSALSDIGR